MNALPHAVVLSFEYTNVKIRQHICTGCHMDASSQAGDDRYIYTLMIIDICMPLAIRTCALVAQQIHTPSAHDDLISTHYDILMIMRCAPHAFLTK